MKEKTPRLFSEEDEAFFRASVKDAAPLKKFRARTAPRKQGKMQQDPKTVEARPRLQPAPEPWLHDTPAPAIGGHAEMHLRRGRMEPDARLDLHGHTQTSAYRAVLGFLHRGQTEGWRLTLIITGKGGVLRQELPFWLGQSALKPLIAGIAPSHIRHGGAGAFYVFLRRKRRSVSGK